MKVLALWPTQLDGWEITKYGDADREFGVGHVEFEVTLKHKRIDLREISENVHLGGVCI